MHAIYCMSCTMVHAPWHAKSSEGSHAPRRCGAATQAKQHYGILQSTLPRINKAKGLISNDIHNGMRSALSRIYSKIVANKNSHNVNSAYALLTSMNDSVGKSKKGCHDAEAVEDKHAAR